MSWYPEQEDIPIDKPDELLKLESQDPAVLDAMTSEEMRIHLRKIAYGMANKVKQQTDGDYDRCVLVVSTAMRVAGHSLGGRLGNMMLSQSAHEAKIACRERFPQKGELEEP